MGFLRRACLVLSWISMKPCFPSWVLAWASCLCLALPAAAAIADSPKALPAPVAAQPADAPKPVIEDRNQKKPATSLRAPAPPKPAEIPRGATARCNDNTYSFAKDRKALCAGHGGVLRALNP
jgi:hypothetical protein